MLFDLPDTQGNFNTRLHIMTELIDLIQKPWIRVIPQFKVTSEVELNQRLDKIMASGGEGLILHRASALYVAGRSDDVLKLKPFQDEEAIVIAYFPGQGKYQGMLGSLLVENQDGLRFKLGSGFSDDSGSVNNSGSSSA